jgi:two-component system, chemotaxis family, chemotaxis protein CheY
MRALLVDDDDGMRQVVRRLVESCGFDSIAEAADGRQAIDLLSHTPADLIVTDCQMPVMDGISMVRALRQAGNATPVIMVSSQECAALVVTAVRAGVNNYVRKPINPDIFREKVQQVMGQAVDPMPTNGVAGLKSTDGTIMIPEQLNASRV